MACETDDAGGIHKRMEYGDHINRDFGDGVDVVTDSIEAYIN